LIVEKGLEEKKVFPLYTKLTIGRSSRNDISVSDRIVSKRHAVVVRGRDRLIVKDLDSHNGTYLNNEKIDKAVLSSGDRVRIGGVILRLFQTDEIPASRANLSAAIFQSRKRLGGYLVKAKIIDEQVFRTVLDEQKKDQRIGEMLMEMGLANDQEVAKALAKQSKLPFIRLQDVDIPKRVISAVPAEVAEQHLLIPLELKGTKLLVAMADPLDSYAIQILRVTTGMSIETAVAPLGDISEAFSRYYPKEAVQMIVGSSDTLDEELEDTDYV
jgi:predicted component of type VI protein secretion system